MCHQPLLDELGLQDPPSGNFKSEKWALIEKLSFSMLQEPAILEAFSNALED